MFKILVENQDNFPLPPSTFFLLISGSECWYLKTSLRKSLLGFISPMGWFGLKCFLCFQFCSFSSIFRGFWKKPNKQTNLPTQEYKLQTVVCLFSSFDFQWFTSHNKHVHLFTRIHEMGGHTDVLKKSLCSCRQRGFPSSSWSWNSLLAGPR